MPADCTYGFGCNVVYGFEEANTKVESLLEAKGFKVFTRLNLQDIIGESGAPIIGRYIIIGACNPEFAKKLFYADPDIGMLMPCNIIIYELQQGGCRVMIKDPARIMDMISSPVAIEASIEVKESLENLIEELK